MKTCSIHDLLRDLCLKEAHKERFLCVVKVHNRSHSINNERRFVLHERDSHQFDPALRSITSVRSLSCHLCMSPSSKLVHNLTFLRRFVRLRVQTGTSTLTLKSILELVNLRYLKCNFRVRDSAVLFSQVFELRYLQTLILVGSWMERAVAPNEIWEMPQLRHFISAKAIYLPDPLRGQDDCVLKNLQTLLNIRNFKCTEDILKRVPSIKKLSVWNDDDSGTSNYYLHNLGRLNELQSLTCCFWRRKDFFQNIVFPQSLKKRTLRFCCFDWDGFTEKVGSLPHLEKIKLKLCYAGGEWSTVEGKFLCLKFLEIIGCNDLVCWTADSTHFPLLQRLVLRGVMRLKEIPSGIGDTLQSIELLGCGYSVAASAKEILEEQQSLGNEGICLTLRERADVDVGKLMH